MADENGENETMPDPLGSALVLAGKGAGEIVTPQLREQLLGPLAKAYGDHWGAQAEERLRKRREKKRATNLYNHLNAVSLIKHKRSFEDVSEDPTIDEWIDGASKVDENIDPDLADFWRAALVALAQGDTARLRLLRIVRSLGTDDAIYLARGHVESDKFRPARDFDETTGYPARLEKAGVFENIWYDLAHRSVFISMIITMPLGIYQTIVLLANIESGEFAEMLVRFAVPIAIVPTFVAARGYIRWVSSFSRRLTSDGMRLLSFLETVKSAPKPPASSEKPDSSAEAEPVS